MEKSIRIASTLLLLVFFGLSLPAQGTLQLGNDNENPDPTMIEFEQTEYDLGTIKAGEIVKSTFKFKNVGDADLFIDNVKPSCACTALEFPKTAIKPGATGEIYAEIDTEDKEGQQVKYFSVMYNGNPPVERVKLIFKVLPPDGAAPQGQEDGTGIK